MVANHTMNANMAAVLWTIAEEKHSFVSAAGPQDAGKSTVLFAMLEHVPEGTPIHALDGTIEEIREFAASPDGGYLEVGEISDHRPARYIWKEPVRALFETLNTGFSLATTMHADGIDDVFKQVSVDNDISDADASTIHYVVHIRRFGDDKLTYWRRIVGIYEVQNVTGKVPTVSQLFAWRENDDSFVAINAPQLLSASGETLAERAKSISRLAEESQVTIKS